MGPGGVEGILALKAAAVAVGATVIPLAMAALGASFGPVVLWAVLGGAIGFFLPDLWVASKGAARQNDIRRTLPETIDLMAIAVQAGMGLEGARSSWSPASSPEPWARSFSVSFRRSSLVPAGARRFRSFGRGPRSASSRPSPWL